MAFFKAAAFGMMLALAILYGCTDEISDTGLVASVNSSKNRVGGNVQGNAGATAQAPGTSPASAQEQDTPSTSTASGFSGVSMESWKLDESGTFYLNFKNSFGAPIYVEKVNVDISWGSVALAGLPVRLDTGGKASLVSETGAFGHKKVRDSYYAKVFVNYTNIGTGFRYSSSGVVEGKVYKMD